MKRALLVISAILMMSLQSIAQQFTMKGGAIYSKMHTREIEGSVEPLLNYYYEANYAYRFGTNKYWTVGIGYLGSGGTITDKWAVRYITEFVDHYEVDTRFSNLIFPVKFKVSTEHRAHPRYYGFVGAAPAWMFNEDRTLRVIYQENRTLPRGMQSLFDFHPNKFQCYGMLGGGIYYKHIVIDVAGVVNCFNVYKEKEAPVSYNSGVVVTLGVQVSRARNKMW